MKKNISIVIIAVALALFIGACDKSTVSVENTDTETDASDAENPIEETDSSDETAISSQDAEVDDVQANAQADYTRPVFLSAEMSKEVPDYTPSVAPYSTDASLSDVINADRVFLQDEQIEKLVENNFFVTDSGWDEFFEVYENNRYFQDPSFITTDSMMHTYHLYYSMLQKKTEKNFLFDKVKSMSEAMLKESSDQYEALKGTEWEESARINKAFFAVGCALINDSKDQIDDDVADIVNTELAYIEEGDMITASPLTEEYEDYSQYKPRGYYEGDEQLEKYFKAMMWYGRRNFPQRTEVLNRSALLMTLAMDKVGLSDWEAVYTVTSFFAGSSDDNGYYEYMPLIKEAFGDDVSVDNIAGKETEYKAFEKLAEETEVPLINSVPYDDDQGETDKAEESKGYRYMGQRVSLDEAVFAQLVYSKVEMNGSEPRLLPDALDLPAALGSKKALEIMDEMGETDYPNYNEQLSMVSESIKKVPELWSGSLYASWLNTLNPLLTEKGEGYPSFMTNDEWTKKSLESYLGSWTELKHDSILYSKQMMAEMGGGDEEVLDDRGYVEPEPELYMELRNMTVNTINGLKGYGLLSKDDEDNLNILASLAEQLSDISVKELTDVTLSDEEFDLIREYGGSIEHLWAEAMKEQTGEEYNYAEEHPAALIADVATDPNGAVLEEAIGGLSLVYVLVPVEGKLRITRGCVFNYYQFTQPLEDGRLTDNEWRIMCGVAFNDNMEMDIDEHLDDKKPEWTKSYRQNFIYDYDY